MENLCCIAQRQVFTIAQLQEHNLCFRVRQDGLHMNRSLPAVPLKVDGHLIRLTISVKVYQLQIKSIVAISFVATTIGP